MNMRRPHPCSTALFVATLLSSIGFSPEAAAHGGRISQPVPLPPPPHLRDPYAPPPPPTSTPPSSGPPTTPSTPPLPSPPPATPSDPGAGPITGRRTPAERRRAGADGGWESWWDANADGLRAGRRARRVTTEIAAPGQSSDADLAQRHGIDAEILPTLRWALDEAKGRDPDVTASALLALGKTSADPRDVAKMKSILERRDASAMERESAALSLGLLRRSSTKDMLDGKELDRIRSALFDAIDDSGVHVRARCFAALSLGLLGDQPTNPDDAFARDGRLVVRGLWARLQEPDCGEETSVAILIALAMQPSRGIPEAVLTGLRSLATTGRMGSRDRGSLTQAHAVQTLTRLSDGSCTGVLLGLLKGGKRDLHLTRSAILSLGIMAARMDGTQRAAAADELCAHARRGDPDTAGLALVTASRILAEDFAEGQTVAADRSKIVDTLLDAAGHGASDVRPFAALGLGLACVPTDKARELRTFASLREKAVALLRDAASDDSTPADARGAYAIALGLAEDGPSEVLLVRLATRRGGDGSLRAHACAGLGLLGRATREVLEALKASLAERSSDDLRREAARALGFLGDTSAVPGLLLELERATSDHVRARVALALGAIQDPRAIRGLVTLAKNPDSTDATRAIALASLGLVGDLERVPSLSRFGSDSNYLARTDALHEALSLL